MDIIHKNNNSTESIGGIIYSILGFYLAGAGQGEIYPFFNIDKNYFNQFSDFINELKFSTDFLEKRDKSINKVNLYFEGENLKFECYNERAEKVNLGLLDPETLASSNLLINMISGFELELNDLIWLREKTSGKIYFDLHTLTRDINKEGKRNFRPIPYYEKWISCCNLIQMNEKERLSLNENFSEVEFIEYVMRLGVEVVNITKAEEGAVCYFKEGNEIKKTEYKHIPDKEVKNVVGCGDIFGAVFFYNYCKNVSPEECLKKAVTISTEKTYYESISEVIEKMRNDK